MGCLFPDKLFRREAIQALYHSFLVDAIAGSLKQRNRFAGIVARVITPHSNQEKTCFWV